MVLIFDCHSFFDIDVFFALMSKSMKALGNFLVKDFVKSLSLIPLIKAVMTIVWSKSLTYSVLLLNLLTKSLNNLSRLSLIDFGFDLGAYRFWL